MSKCLIDVETSNLFLSCLFRAWYNITRATGGKRWNAGGQTWPFKLSFMKVFKVSRGFFVAAVNLWHMFGVKLNPLLK